MYWTVNLSPSTAPGPVPVIRLASSGFVGGDPGGTTSVGSLPHTGRRRVGERREDDARWVHYGAAVVVVVGAAVVVVVVGDLLEKSSAPVPSTRTATIATMMPRRVFCRRFARRCISSILIRRAAF